MNHDVRFKMLLKTPSLLQGFFEAFLPEAAPFVDFNTIEFVDTERATPDGHKRTGDLLVKTRFRGEKAGFLIHLEHQAQPDRDLARRMLEYFVLDWLHYDLPVYPIAVLSHRGSARNKLVPLTVQFPNRKILDFDFDVINLGSMDAETYVTIENPASLALSARMRFPKEKRWELIREFALTLTRMMSRLPAADMVAKFFFAYHKMSAEEELHLLKEIGTVDSTDMRNQIMQTNNPWINVGLREGLAAGREEGLAVGREEGLAEGRLQGEAELILRLLSRRLGKVSDADKRAIRKLELSKIEDLGEALLQFDSHADLTRWLRKNRSY
jgi:hypothetical protein